MIAKDLGRWAISLAKPMVQLLNGGLSPAFIVTRCIDGSCNNVSFMSLIESQRAQFWYSENGSQAGHITAFCRWYGFGRMVIKGMRLCSLDEYLMYQLFLSVFYHSISKSKGLTMLQRKLNVREYILIALALVCCYLMLLYSLAVLLMKQKRR